MWDFGNGDISIEETPTYYYLYSTEGTYYYSLEVANAAGCTDSMTQEIYLEFRKALFIRNNYTEMLNLLQANIMSKLNNKKYKKLDKKFLDDALMTSIAGISAAMKNTG